MMIRYFYASLGFLCLLSHVIYAEELKLVLKESNGEIYLKVINSGSKEIYVPQFERRNTRLLKMMIFEDGTLAYVSGQQVPWAHKKSVIQRDHSTYYEPHYNFETTWGIAETPWRSLLRKDGTYYIACFAKKVNSLGFWCSNVVSLDIKNTYIVTNREVSKTTIPKLINDAFSKELNKETEEDQRSKKGNLR